jgi:hypothetical protein
MLAIMRSNQRGLSVKTKRSAINRLASGRGVTAPLTNHAARIIRFLWSVYLNWVIRARPTEIARFVDFGCTPRAHDSFAPSDQTFSKTCPRRTLFWNSTAAYTGFRILPQCLPRFQPGFGKPLKVALRRWALSAVGAGEGVVRASEYVALQQQVRELQRLLGKKRWRTSKLSPHSG